VPSFADQITKCDYENIFQVMAKALAIGTPLRLTLSIDASNRHAYHFKLKRS
jgi:hypothetical protein